MFKDNIGPARSKKGHLYLHNIVPLKKRISKPKDDCDIDIRTSNLNKVKVGNYSSFFEQEQKQKRKLRLLSNKKKNNNDPIVYTYSYVGYFTIEYSNGDRERLQSANLKDQSPLLKNVLNTKIGKNFDLNGETIKLVSRKVSLKKDKIKKKQ